MMIYLLKVETTEVARDSLKKDEYMYIQYRSNKCCINKKVRNYICFKCFLLGWWAFNINLACNKWNYCSTFKFT